MITMTKSQILLLTMTVSLLISGTASAQTEPQVSVNETFGVTVGESLTLPDCSRTSVDTTCGYYAYLIREESGETSTPIHVPAPKLPSYVDSKSVRIQAANGRITNLRYSMHHLRPGTAFTMSERLVAKYGKAVTFNIISSVSDSSDHSKSRVTAFRAHWNLPTVTVSINVVDPVTSFDNSVDVKISAK